MATISVQTIVKGGLTPTFSAAAAGGDQFRLNDKNDIYWIKNGSGGSVTVTFITQATTDGLAVADRAISVPAGAERVVSDLDPQVYRDANGYCQVTYSAVTSVTVGAFRSNGAG
jgi:hypothetical protein